MELKIGDYIKVAGLSVDQIRRAIKKFKDAGFNDDHTHTPTGIVKGCGILWLGVDTESDICGLENHELFGTDIRELTYDELVNVPCETISDDPGEYLLGEGAGYKVTFKDSFADLNADPVNHPPHYTQHPSGVECIQITEHMGFNLGNAIKYVWRADLKNDAVEDLKKAAFYINREIAKRVATNENS